MNADANPEMTGRHGKRNRHLDKPAPEAIIENILIIKKARSLPCSSPPFKAFALPLSKKKSNTEGPRRYNSLNHRDKNTAAALRAYHTIMGVDRVAILCHGFEVAKFRMVTEKRRNAFILKSYPAASLDRECHCTRHCKGSTNLPNSKTSR